LKADSSRHRKNFDRLVKLEKDINDLNEKETFIKKPIISHPLTIRK